MFKKSILFLNSLLFILLFTGCDHNITETMVPHESIKVKLFISDLRGWIDITNHQVVEAVITVTAPDAARETKTWVPGCPETLTFQNRGTGTYNIAVTEKDEVDNEASY